jgi:hypothetical protein
MFSRTPKEEFAKTKFTVAEVVAVDKFEEWGKTRETKPRIMNKADRLKEMTERAGKDGRFAVVEIERDGVKDSHTGLILIRFKDGKPWIVGLTE